MRSFFLNVKIRRYILPFLGGTFYALGFPSTLAPHFFFMPIIGFFLFFQSFYLHFSWKTDLLSLLFFSFGMYLVGYYWIPYTLKEFGSIPFPLNVMIGPLLSFILFPQYLFFIFLYRITPKIQCLKRIPSWNLSIQSILLTFSFTLLEYYIPQQFPTHLGHPWLQLAPYLGLAPIFGVPLFSFASYWLAFVFLGRLKIKKWDFLGIAFFITFITINFLFPLPPREKEGHLTKIRMVQANIGNFMKLSGKKGDTLSLKTIQETYLNLSTKLKSQVDLVLWPETAFSYVLDSELMKKDLNFVPSILLETIYHSKAQLILGGYDKAKDASHADHYQTEYNAIFYFNRQGYLEETYHKRLLMPFGETLPFGPLNPLFSKLIKNISFFARGEGFPLFVLDNGTPLINAICYEILFSRYIRDYLIQTSQVHGKRAEFILNLTNDSWYGKSSEPYQHQFLSHWRALEFQIPVVRMTNTGLSSILYPDGSQSKNIGLFQKLSRDYEFFTKKASPTLFQKYGFFLTLILFLFLFSLLIKVKKN